MQDRVGINREYFFLDLLTGRGVTQPAKMLSWLVQEFLGLTLLPNRDVAKVLQAYRNMLGLGEYLPEPIYDQWMLRRVQGKNAPQEISGSADRKRLRQHVFRMRGAAYEIIENQLGLIPRNVEHIAFRLIPVQIVKPQSRGKERNQVLLAAYHLEQCWLHIARADPCPGYAKRNDAESANLSAILTQKQWVGYADEIRNRQVTSGGNPSMPIILHAPKGSGLSSVMGDTRDFFVAEDMPPHRPRGAILRIHYKIKHSVAKPLQQVTLADLLREPSIEDILQDADMATLPVLDKLSHRQKNILITTLWSALTTLRQKQSQGD